MPAVTTDPFIVFTSSAFAILGLRSLHFALAGLMAAGPDRGGQAPRVAA